MAGPTTTLAPPRAEMTTPSIPTMQCRGLSKSFEDLVAVDDVSFSIAPGETYGLLGPNGAGKTTTISMIGGILSGDRGEVVINGRVMTTKTVQIKDSIGYVPQELALYPDLSARENLAFFARLYGMKRRAAERRIEEVLTTIDLRDRARDLVKTYSGGMKRRLNIGIGLLHRPELLILDEPTVGVDPQSRAAILDNVRRLSIEGMAVLYTTHYMEEAEKLCDRIGIIDHGKLIAEGTVRELVALVGEKDRVVLAATGDLAGAAMACRALERVVQVDVRTEGIDLIVRDARAVLPEILRVAAASATTIRSVTVHEPDLEAVFLHLTGKSLRD